MRREERQCAYPTLMFIDPVVDDAVRSKHVIDVKWPKSL